MERWPPGANSFASSAGKSRMGLLEGPPIARNSMASLQSNFNAAWEERERHPTITSYDTHRDIIVRLGRSVLIG